MSKSRLPAQTDASSGKCSRFTTVPNSRKSESEDSSDPFESPTTHCYIAGTRPKRTMPRRTLSTGIVGVKRVTTSMSAVLLNSKLGSTSCTTNITPPRSKSAVNFKGVGSKDSVLYIPNLGDRAIYTPVPPSLSKFYATDRTSSDSKMDINTSPSLHSIAMSLDSMKLDSSPLLSKGTWRRSMAGSYRSLRQPSPNTMRQNSKYVSDEEMHIVTTTEEEDSDIEMQLSNRSITSTRSFRTGLSEKAQNVSGSNPSWFARIAPRSRNKRASILQSHILQPANQNLSPPVVIISKCDTYPSVAEPEYRRNIGSHRENLALPGARYEL